MCNKTLIGKQNKTEIERARSIAKSLGVKVASRYLFNRSWSIEAALYALFGIAVRTPSNPFDAR